jgi:hypothetical protein
MDTTRILLRSTDPISDIMARYGTDGSCGTWANEMGSLWMNYYDIKNRTIYPVKARMLTTIDTYMTPTTGYQDRLS